LKHLDAQTQEAEGIYGSLKDSGALREARRVAAEKIARASLVGEEFCRSMASKAYGDVDAARATGKQMESMSASLGRDTAITAAAIQNLLAPGAAATKLMAEGVWANAIDSSWYLAAERMALPASTMAMADRLSSRYGVLE